MAEQIYYAQHIETEKIVYIRNAKNGLSCNCRCVACGERLEAIQGKVRQWHYRHNTNINCNGGQETAIHKLAKQIIAENSSIHIPNELFQYSDARLEKGLFDIVPDVTVKGNECDVYFEVVVTNPVEATKELFYKNGQHKSVEITLKGIPYDINPVVLQELVMKTAKRRKIFWDANQNTPEKEKSIAEKLILPAIIFSGLIFLLKKVFYKKKRNR